MSLGSGGIKTAIIIIHYQNGALTERCLESLLKQTKACIFVVDNGSDLPIAELLTEKFASPQIQCLRSSSNLGYGGACNLGVSQAIAQGYQGLIILNNDTVVVSDLAQEFAARSASLKHKAILVPQIFTPDGQIWYSGGYFSLTQMRVGHLEHSKPEHLTSFVNGCCFWVTAALWQKLQGFDPKYFLYLEDLDLSLRARNLGIPLVFTPQIHLIHYPSSSTGGRHHPRSIYYQNRNRWLLLKVHGQKLHWLGFLPFFLLGFIKRCFRFWRSPVQQKANLRALFDGIKMKK